jgi:cytochrome P450
MGKSGAEIARDFDHTDANQASDPFPLYKRLRSECPISRSEKWDGFWLAASYDLVRELALDHSAYSSTDGGGIPKLVTSPMYPIDLDPPQQTKFRKILNPRFTEKVVEKWRPIIQAETDRLIGQFSERGSADFAAELCRPMSAAVILPMIGIPLEARADLADWIEQMNRGRSGDPASLFSAYEAISRYLKGLCCDRRATPPRDDIIGDLLQARVDGMPLSDDDIFRVLVLLLFAGLDTAISVMLEGLKFFSDYPGERKRLETGLTPWSLAVEELVRLVTPAQGVKRLVKKDVTVNGHQIKGGESILLLWGSANRDETKFESPDSCQLDRFPNPHMGFGMGPHICLGRSLARLEIDILLRTVFARLPDYRVPADFKPEYHVGEVRSMKSLPVEFTPQRALSVSA